MLNRDYRRAMLRRAEASDADRPDVPWLSRLRSGPWLQSDPGDRPDQTR
jgi:hypothetical protein